MEGQDLPVRIPSASLTGVAAVLVESLGLVASQRSYLLPERRFFRIDTALTFVWASAFWDELLAFCDTECLRAPLFISTKEDRHAERPEHHDYHNTLSMIVSAMTSS